MSTLPFTGKIGAVFVSLAAVAVIAAACGGGGDEGAPNGGTPSTSEIAPIVVNSELVVGENRFMIGLLSSENEEITGAEVGFRFFKLDGDQQELRGEAQATPITLEKSYTEIHEDGTVETHSAGESGVYVATVQFDAAGQWGVEITATVGGTTYDPIRAGFNVLEEGATIAVGAPAPRSETLTLDDVDDVAEIDTSDPPIPEMHAMTIAEAVTSARPSVIVFATPAFCVSRICGPTKDVVDELFEEYKGEVNFVHIEPWELDPLRTGQGFEPVPAMLEWGLCSAGGCSEPWVFLVDGEGNVAAKFEAVVTLDELKQALTPLVGASDVGNGFRY